MEKYEPNLIGVEHSGHFVNPVLQKILDIRPRPQSVGIEAPPRNTISGSNIFWDELSANLKKNGITVKFLCTDSFLRAMNRELFKDKKQIPAFLIEALGEIRITEAISSEKITGKLSALISYVLPKMMTKQALLQKPDVIICGSAHMPILRKSLHIPKNKVQLVLQRNIQKSMLRSRCQHEIRRVRRFESHRRENKLKFQQSKLKK